MAQGAAGDCDIAMQDCFHSNVLREEEHRSTADRIVDHKVCFAVLTLLQCFIRGSFPRADNAFQCVSPVLHARTLMQSREEADGT
jgi:hypothetical protein